MEEQNQLPEGFLGNFVGHDGGINVKALLVARNIRQNDIAKKYGLGKAEVNKVVNKKRNTLHIRRKIADELNMTFEDLWGSR